jgi:type IV pilus assembly protein PilA
MLNSNLKNMYKKLQQGFTLIELLVVIAIIGILAAVVIGSLNDARQGGQNASAQQSVANIRSQAELVYNSNGYSYDTVCSDAKIDILLDGATKAVGGTAYTAATHGISTYVATNGSTVAARTAACHDSAIAYVAVSPLADGTNFWCVDSTGASKQVATAPASGAMVCP